MFLARKLMFKMMELGLGLRTCFSLDTRNPVFVNFRLSEGEADAVRRSLPDGFELMSLKFMESDGAPAPWLSFNLYELQYPKKELAAIRKGRCEINTFVRDARGRRGIFVFCGSPYVSREETASPIGKICDAAERAVMGLYRCGRLIPLTYRITDREMEISFEEGGNALRLARDLSATAETERLSDDYWAFNDVSFFNGGKTHDFVHVGHDFFAARFARLDASPAAGGRFQTPFFQRPPDGVYLHRGTIAYLVNALNRDTP